MSVPDWMIDVPTPNVDDMAALIRRLVRELRKAAPSNDLADKALDYLARKGLDARVMRDDGAPVAPTPAQPSDTVSREDFERMSADLTRAKNLLVRLYDKHPAARDQIAGSTGAWFVWGVDRDALPSEPEGEAAK